MKLPGTKAIQQSASDIRDQLGQLGQKVDRVIVLFAILATAVIVTAIGVFSALRDHLDA